MANMRSRVIKPEFFRNEDLGSVNFAARLLFAGLWCTADRDGRLRDRPVLIRADVFPTDVNVTANDVNQWLEDLASIGVIERYEVGGTRYLAVKNFNKHQRIHPNEAKSVIPPPPSGNGPSTDGNAPTHLHGVPMSNHGASSVGECRSTSTSTSSYLSLGRESRQRADARRRQPRSGSGSPEGFDRFWSAYPNRTHRIEAQAAWRQVAPDPDTVDRIVAAIEVWRTSRQWSQKQFIPHPATWLRNRLWEDEFVATAGAQQATQSATALDSLRRQYEFLRRRAEAGGEQARLTLAEFVRDQGAKLGLDQGTTGEPPAPPLEEVAP